MNWSSPYKEICDYLEQNNQKQYSDYLKEALSIGATGGEIFDIAITRLIELRKLHVLDGIAEKVEVILNYAKSIGHL